MGSQKINLLCSIIIAKAFNFFLFKIKKYCKTRLQAGVYTLRLILNYFKRVSSTLLKFKELNSLKNKLRYL